MPGLSDPEAAFEVGRALRMIGHILDSQRSPIEHGRQFLSQLGNAVVFFAMCGERQPWGAEDTDFVFRETFKAASTDAQKAYDAILGYARKRPIAIGNRQPALADAPLLSRPTKATKENNPSRSTATSGASPPISTHRR